MVNAIDNAVEQLCKSELSNYKIAQETGFSDVVIGNWRKGKTRPSRANAVALLRYFQNKERANTLEQSIQQDTAAAAEQPVGVSDKMISFLIDQCQLKDKQLNEARQTIEELQQQINQLKNM